MPKQKNSELILKKLMGAYESKRNGDDIDMVRDHEAHFAISSLARIVKDLENPLLGQEGTEFFLKDLKSKPEGRFLLDKLSKLKTSDLYPNTDQEDWVRKFLTSNRQLVHLIKKNMSELNDLYHLSQDESFKNLYNEFIRSKVSEGLGNSPKAKKGMMELIFEKELSALKSEGVEVKGLENLVKLFDDRMKPKLFDKDKAVSFIEKMFSAIEDLKTTKGTEHSARKMTSKPESSKGFSK